MIPLRTRCSAVGGCLLAFFSATAAARVRVEVDGLAGVEKANVEARLTIKARGGEKDLDQSQVERLHKQAEADIREALQPYGYYSPKIAATLTGAKPDWIARYDVEPGPPTRVVAIDTQYEGEGKDFPKLKGRLRVIPLKLGNRLIHADYEATKKRMSDAAFGNGYLDARWTTSELLVEPDKHEARVTLQLDTGPRYFFGPVTVQQDFVDPALIDRYVRIKPGDPFDPQKLLDLQFALSDLGYFDLVAIEPERDQTDAGKRIPIVVRATPRAKVKFDTGVGYGTDTGARVSLGTEWRQLNYYGHTLKTDFRLSEIKNTLEGEYRIPQGNTPGEYLAFSAAAETEKLDSGNTDKYTIGTSLYRELHKWQRRVYLEFTHEESDFGDTAATSDLLTPGVSFTRTVADDPIDTRKGWYLFTDFHGAARNVLSNTSFLQTRILLRGVYPYGRNFRILARTEFGYSLVEEFGELAASQRFFAGGDQSVRGYKYQSLGPKDSDGDVIGGKYLTTYSLEGEYRVYRNYGLAAFVDAGGADDNPGPTLHVGAGIGLRYKAPIGSLSIDLAHPFDKGESPVRFNIGVRVGV